MQCREIVVVASFPPNHPEAHMGFIIMEPEYTPPMSGSNSICVSTVLLESSIVPMQEPVTDMALEAPGGLVRVRADCRDGKVERITVRNLPSFVSRMGAVIEVLDVGSMNVDTAYGVDDRGDQRQLATGHAFAGDAARPESGPADANSPARSESALKWLAALLNLITLTGSHQILRILTPKSVPKGSSHCRARISQKSKSTLKEQDLNSGPINVAILFQILPQF